MKKFASSVRKNGMNSILIYVQVRLISTLDCFGSFLVIKRFCSSGGPRHATFFCRFFALSYGLLYVILISVRFTK